MISELGPFVRDWRKLHGLTQVELARQCGFSPTTLRTLEACEAQPSSKVMQGLIRVIGDEITTLATPTKDYELWSEIKMLKAQVETLTMVCKELQRGRRCTS
jgi:transcriptional regulator with XRE-family HTH domain